MLLLDRMHWVPRPRHRRDTTPRDILLGAHYYDMKEHILRASRNKAKPPDDYPNQKLFMDLSATKLGRQRDFALIVEILRSNGTRYRWGFPTKMLVNKEGRIISLLSPEDGLPKLRSWGLENMPDEQADTQHWRIKLDWHKTHSKR
ncbi:Hypothetical predicted protein [Pelobates cultripes]|uniref:Uncharacterized protein n=1 Tax=Pelobates cultripes TaxID=61616 RepID=A0AAD1W6C7_PELCU|nr:Hypothetical predicted protein [Pelobates cultripes]